MKYSYFVSTSDTDDCGYGGWAIDSKIFNFNITLTESIEGYANYEYTLEEIDELLDKIQARSRSK